MEIFEMNWWKKKKEKEKEKKRGLLGRERGAMLLEDLIKCCDGKSNPIKFFSADLILKATNNFSDFNRIPGFQSFYWELYSGKTDDHRMIIIKKYSYFDSDFCRDVAISSMVSGHKNFMKLAGCCLEFDKYPVMVYYGEKKLYSSVDLEKIVLWNRRMKIAEDIATALAYLHTAFSSPFVYRIMSIQNILIDEDGVAKLTDFSCCISIPQGETFVKVDEIVGTFGYMDSNSLRNNIISEKTDAYSFGIFMLMLLTGKGGTFGEVVEHDGDCVNPKWVSRFIEEGGLVDEMADPKILENLCEITEKERCRMNAFRLLSVRCFGRKGEVPTMTQVAKELKKILKSSQNTPN